MRVTNAAFTPLRNYRNLEIRTHLLYSERPRSGNYVFPWYQNQCRYESTAVRRYRGHMVHVGAFKLYELYKEDNAFYESESLIMLCYVTLYGVNTPKETGSNHWEQ